MRWSRTYEADAVAVTVDRIGRDGDRYGLSLIPLADVIAQPPPAVVSASGHHSRWAGQPGPAELAAGQLADVSVLLRNTGTG